MVTPAWEHLVDLGGPLPNQLFVPGVCEEDVQVLSLLGIVVVCMQQGKAWTINDNCRKL